MTIESGDTLDYRVAMRGWLWAAAAAVGSMSVVGCARDVSTEAPYPSVGTGDDVVLTTHAAGTGGMGAGTGGGGAPSASTGTEGSGGAPSTDAGAGGSDPTTVGAGGGTALGPEETIATGLVQPQGITTLGGYVYVTEAGSGGPPDGGLTRIPKSGGPLERVVTGQSFAFAISVSNGRVAWTNYNTPDGELKAYDPSDGSFETLATGLGYPWALAPLGDDIVVTEGMIGQVSLVHADHSIDALWNGDGYLTGICTHGAATFFTTGTDGVADAALHSVLGGTDTSLYPLGYAPSLVVSRGTDLYFSIWDGSIVHGTTAGDPSDVLASGIGQTTGLAVDDHYVYWVTYDVDVPGFLSRVPRAGGPVEVLAPVVRAWGMTVDDEGVYWIANSNQAPGEVHRMLKTN